MFRRERRRQGDRKLIARRSDRLKRDPSGDGEVDAGLAQRSEDFGGALVEHGDEQMLGAELLASAFGEQPGGALGLDLQVAGAHAERVASGGNDGAK